MKKTVKVNDRTYVNPIHMVLIALNSQTLKTTVFLDNGVAVESDLSLDDTAKAFDDVIIQS